MGNLVSWILELEGECMMKNILTLIVALGLVLTALSGCTSSDEDAGKEENEDGNDQKKPITTDDIKSPVTIKVAYTLGEEEFKEKVKKPTEDHFPNVTLEQIVMYPEKSSIEEQLGKQNVPDIIFGANLLQLHNFKGYELLYDMTDLIQKFDYDLNSYNQGYINAISAYSGGKFAVLPNAVSKYALHYNKDIFDLSGVSYPTEDMTWKEVVDLASKVAVTRNGNEYMGLALPNPRILLGAMSAPLIDPKTDEPLFTENPKFKEMFGLYKKVYDLPNAKPILQGGAVSEFIGEQTLAMVPIFYLGASWTGMVDATNQGLNWDMVSFPSWEGEEPVAPLVGGAWSGVTKASKHKNAAFKVLKFWHTSKQIGAFLTSPMAAPYTPEKVSGYMEEHADQIPPKMKDKNLEALFSHPTIKEQPERSQYEDLIYPLLLEEVEAFIDPEKGGSKDINTILRELQEKAKAVVQEAKAK